MQRKKAEDRAVEIIAEEMNLRDLRKARKLTQARVAKVLGVTQDSVSRLEKRSDLLLSTLRKTVKAMGGDVRIVAEFPDRAPVVLSDLSEDDKPRKSSRRHAAHKPKGDGRAAIRNHISIHAMSRLQKRNEPAHSRRPQVCAVRDAMVTSRRPARRPVPDP